MSLVLLAEHVPPRRRGLLLGLVMSFSLLVLLAVLLALNANTVTIASLSALWRLPFTAAAVLLALSFVFTPMLVETSVYEKEQAGCLAG